MPVKLGECFKCKKSTGSEYSSGFYACVEHDKDARKHLAGSGGASVVTPPVTAALNVPSNSPNTGDQADEIPPNLVGHADGTVEVEGPTLETSGDTNITVSVALGSINGTHCPVCEGKVRSGSVRHKKLQELNLL